MIFEIPPAAIKGLVSNLLDGLVGPLTSKQVKYLALVNNNAERMTRMIGDLLDLSRISAGKIHPRFSKTLDFISFNLGGRRTTSISNSR